MNTLTIDKKKYVIVLQKEYEQLLLKAARKEKPVRKHSLLRGKKIAKCLIDQLNDS
jgi:hypothetical protein